MYCGECGKSFAIKNSVVKLLKHKFDTIELVFFIPPSEITYIMNVIGFTAIYLLGACYSDMTI